MEPVNCPTCGFSKSPTGARFCANCGGALPAPSGETVVVNANVQVGQVQGGSVTGVSIGKIIGTVIFGGDDEARARERRNLRVLLQKVSDFWVEGVLKSSLGGLQAVELEKRLAPEAVLQPLQELAQTPAPDLPASLPIQQAFDELDKAVLILDGAGSGKTTTLLNLARAAVERAGADPEQPIPVVLNLASWTQLRQPVADWVAAELALRYQIPTEMGKKWLDEQRLALLLDGLDEVGSENLPDCIKGLNEFRQQYGLLPVSICVRSQDYRAAGERLQLAGALELLPLTDAQVREYLAAAGASGQTLQTLLKEDEDLRVVASSPLMLNVMRQALEGMTIEDLGREQFDSQEERRQHLIGRYLQKVLEHRTGAEKPPFTREQVLSWLGELARGMQRQTQAIFQVEQLQPSWIRNGGLRLFYWLVSRGLVGLALGVLLAGTAEVGGTPAGRAAYVVCAVLASLLVGGAAAWLEGKPENSKGKSAALFTRRMGWVLFCALVSAVVCLGVFRGVLRLGQDAWRIAAGMGSVYAVLFGLDGLRPAGRDVRPVEALTWSLRQGLRGVLPGLGALAGAVLVVAAIFARSNPLAIWLRYGLVYGLMGLGAMIVIYGLQGRAVEQASYPNQGAWLSWRNAARAGGLLGLLAWAGYALSYGVAPGLVVGLRVGLLAGLWYGAQDGIRAGLLRLILSSDGQLPLRLVPFLDYTARLGLVQKVGGGYRFSSRLVQKSLADEH